MEELYGGIEPELCDGVAQPILLVDDDIALSQTMALAIENVGRPVREVASVPSLKPAITTYCDDVSSLVPTT